MSAFVKCHNSAAYMSPLPPCFLIMGQTESLQSVCSLIVPVISINCFEQLGQRTLNVIEEVWRKL